MRKCTANNAKKCLLRKTKKRMLNVFIRNVDEKLVRQTQFQTAVVVAMPGSYQCGENNQRFGHDRHRRRSRNRKSLASLKFDLTSFAVYVHFRSRKAYCLCKSRSGVTIRYDTRSYFNVRSKSDMSQLNLPHGTNN